MLTLASLNGENSVTTIINEYWKKFLSDTNRTADITYFEAFAFGINEIIANNLLNLVLCGIKTATCSSKIEYEITNTRIPQIGDLSIVTDWNGIPKCVIETTHVSLIKFNEMTYDICMREGEDKNLETWIEGHTQHFTASGKKLGFEFDNNMEIIFEDFSVVYK